MKKNKILISIVCIPLILLSSCASYQASSLNNISSEILVTPSTTNQVLATAKAFTKADCKRYLDRDVIAKGYQPVQIYIQNNSDRTYNFSLDRISLSQARPDEVANQVHTSTVGRAVGYGVGALFLWPLAIPAIVDGIKSSEANASLDSDFAAKVARNQTIAQHSHLNKIIFVPVSEYQQNFTITLIDQASNNPKVLNVTAD